MNRAIAKYPPSFRFAVVVSQKNPLTRDPEKQLLYSRAPDLQTKLKQNKSTSVKLSPGIICPPWVWTVLVSSSALRSAHSLSHLFKPALLHSCCCAWSLSHHAGISKMLGSPAPTGLHFTVTTSFWALFRDLDRATCLLYTSDAADE